jgi:nitrite reductase (NO-forming)
MVRRHPARWLAAMTGAVMLAMAPAMAQEHNHATGTDSSQATTAQPVATPADGTSTAASPAVSYHNATIFTLKTGIAGGRMVYIGVGGDIDGQTNPTLMVHEGELVQINLINGEGAEHDVVIDQYPARSSIVVGINASSTFSFIANKVGEFT